MFTVEILGSVSMSTVVSGSGDVGPVTASGSTDIIIVTAGSGTNRGVCLRGQSSELQLKSLSALRVALLNRPKQWPDTE